jgi:hypothetical protein
MRKLIGSFIAGLLLIAAPLVKAQEHAPLLDQCKADIALWYSDESEVEYRKAENAHRTDGTKNRTDYAKLPIKVLNFRVGELVDCWSVSGQDDRYFKAARFYGEIREDRYYRFLVRHHLIKQLLTEDEKGIR